MIGLKILAAFFYDILLLCAVWFVSAIPFLLWQGQGFDQKPLTLLAFQIYLIAITYAYLTYFWIHSGQTPGLKTWKLQIVRENDCLLTQHDANSRFIFTSLLFWIGWIGLFMPQKQLLQDHLSKTKIITVKQ